MKNYLKIDHENGLLIMDRTFAKNAENTRSSEYSHLQSVRRDYPTYTVIRREIKKNPEMNHYKGLTYEYMEDYILTHESKETVDKVIEEFEEMILISRCHSKAFRYPVIKKWFLARYPEIAKFGRLESKSESNIIAVPDVENASSF